MDCYARFISLSGKEGERADPTGDPSGWWYFIMYVKELFKHAFTCDFFFCVPSSSCYLPFLSLSIPSYSLCMSLFRKCIFICPNKEGPYNHMHLKWPFHWLFLLVRWCLFVCFVFLVFLVFFVELVALRSHWVKRHQKFISLSLYAWCMTSLLSYSPSFPSSWESTSSSLSLPCTHRRPPLELFGSTSCSCICRQESEGVAVNVRRKERSKFVSWTFGIRDAAFSFFSCDSRFSCISSKWDGHQKDVFQSSTLSSTLLLMVDSDCRSSCGFSPFLLLRSLHSLIPEPLGLRIELSFWTEYRERKRKKRMDKSREERFDYSLEINHRLGSILSFRINGSKCVFLPKVRRPFRLGFSESLNEEVERKERRERDGLLWCFASSLSVCVCVYECASYVTHCNSHNGHLILLLCEWYSSPLRPTGCRFMITVMITPYKLSATLLLLSHIATLMTVCLLCRECLAVKMRKTENDERKDRRQTDRQRSEVRDFSPFSFHTCNVVPCNPWVRYGSIKGCRHLTQLARTWEDSIKGLRLKRCDECFLKTSGSPKKRIRSCSLRRLQPQSLLIARHHCPLRLLSLFLSFTATSTSVTSDCREKRVRVQLPLDHFRENTRLILSLPPQLRRSNLPSIVCVFHASCSSTSSNMLILDIPCKKTTTFSSWLSTASDLSSSFIDSRCMMVVSRWKIEHAHVIAFFASSLILRLLRNTLLLNTNTYGCHRLSGPSIGSNSM